MNPVRTQIIYNAVKDAMKVCPCGLNLRVVFLLFLVRK